MNKKVSLKDIAAAAGVSTALVSYVLNNKKEGRISKAVAEKIKEIASVMNYRTNQIARSLKTNKTFTIGLVLADISNPFSAAVARVIEDEADKFGYTVIFGSSDENPDKYRKILDALVNRQADGLILSPPAQAAPQVMALQQQRLPFVLIDRYFPALASNYVILDNHKAAFDATQHLVNCGYHRLGIINYASTLVHLAERTRGFLDALTENNIAFTDSPVYEVDQLNLKESTEKAVDHFLKNGHPVKALLLGSNVIAMHAVAYINQQGYKIPGEIALACFDETAAFDLFYAPLTCIRQPIKAMGQMAVKILLDNINDNNAVVKNISMEGELVIRASTVS